MISILMPIRRLNDTIQKMTDRCIASINENTATPFEIIQEDFDTSIGKTYNKAFERSHGEQICCLHNDVEVTPKWDDNLIIESLKGNIAFPIVDDTQYASEWRGIPRAEEWMPPGCCFMMLRSTWEKLGGNDENFIPYHWEDTDLFYRAKKMGIKLIRTRAKVIHWRGVTRSFLPRLDKTLIDQGKEYFDRKHRNGNGSLLYPKLDNAKDTSERYFV